jgi:hypothetical protein
MITRLTLPCQYVTTSNESVYNEIDSAGGKIFLSDSVQQECWSVNISRNKRNSIIYKGTLVDDIFIFTHEMLHHYNVLINGYMRLLDLYEAIEDYVTKYLDRRLLILFDYMQIRHIDAQIQHGRMLHLYRKLGFDEKYFICDYFRMAQDSDIPSSWDLMCRVRINEGLFVKIIELYFTYRFHPNNIFKKDMINKIIIPCYNENPELIDILDKHCSEWDIKQDMRNNDFIFELLKAIHNWRLHYNYA